MRGIPHPLVREWGVMRLKDKIGNLLLVSMAAAAIAVGTTNFVGQAATPDCDTIDAILTSHYAVHHLDGTVTETAALSNLQVPPPVRPGDVIVGTFTLNPACPTVMVSAASYWAPSAIFSDENQKQQVLFDSNSTTFTTNGSPIVVTQTVKIPLSGIAFGLCPNKHNSSPQTYNGNGGPPPDNQYASTCDGRASENGKGNGNANGKPCQGCVGNADNKNPPGQFPNGSDHNAGYECDRNNGVGKGNPAHSSCVTAHFQVEFVVGPVIPDFFHD